MGGNPESLMEGNMAGRNVVHKILARAAGKDWVSTGEYVIARSKRPVTLCGDTMARGPWQILQTGARRVFDPKMIKIVVGHMGAGGHSTLGDLRRKFRQWACDVGIPRENILDLGQQGVEHIVAGEQCWALPGEIYFSITNGHTTSLGALGGFAVPLSYESGAYLVKGFSWIQVPEVARFTLTGKTQPGVYARDVYEYILGQIGPTGTPGQVIKWDGDYVDSLDMDDRFTLCANALFSSAWTAIVEPDQVTQEYVRTRTNEPFTPLFSDPDAEYAQDRLFEVSAVEPQIVPPPDRTNVYTVSKYEGKKITRGHIGTCANGRLQDMRIAARILKGQKVHPDVILNITPGSTAIYKQCLKEGILETFVDAGVFLPPPACGQCVAGANTPLGDGDVCLSSGTCNYPGRMGSYKSEIYLCSPATVAASAVAGCVTNPRKLL
jgi:3-isopropylmalate/(R)-2-methylmalate dehydratase large subunit